MPIVANESTVPILACSSVSEMQSFYESLGFRTTYRQERPYVYLAVAWSGFELHFRKPPVGSEAANEDAGAAIVLVEDVAAYHEHFRAAVRAAYGRVPTKGLPRLTRFRPGATRFTIYDPSGNAVIVVFRAEPRELEYGGAKELTGLAKALDQARIYREFKNDDRAALRHLGSALRRHGGTATAAQRKQALETMIELARDLDEVERIPEFESELARIESEAPPAP